MTNQNAITILNDLIHFESLKGGMYQHSLWMAIKTLDEQDKMVYCKDCKYCTKLDPHADICNNSELFHCMLYRGEETKNVWHKYTKHYKDYSVVEADDFCSRGEKE